MDFDAQYAPRPCELTELVARQRPNGPANVAGDTFVYDALEFWRHPRASADLRAALLEVLATRPGAKSLGEIHDAAGRPAMAIQLPAEGGRLVVAYDRATSRLPAEGGKVDRGGVRRRMTYAVAAGPVAAVGDRPYTLAGERTFV
jgi:hypothetical protein